MTHEQLTKIATLADEQMATIEAALASSPFQHALEASRRTQEHIDTATALAGFAAGLTLPGFSVGEWDRRVGIPALAKVADTLVGDEPVERPVPRMKKKPRVRRQRPAMLDWARGEDFDY